MKISSRQIHEHFTAWGRASRQLPPRNETLKSVVLNQVPIHTTGAEITRERRGVPWFPLAFASMAILALFIMPRGGVDGGRRYAIQSLSTVMEKQNIGPSGMGSSGGSAMMETDRMSQQRDFSTSRPPIFDNVSITDTREFLRTEYHATLRTKKVGQIGDRIQNIIRGLGGRIDQFYVGARNGNIGFVIPVGNLPALKVELREMVWARFFSENVRVDNLLPQKQSLESEAERLATRLTELRTERENLTSQYRRTITSLRQRLTSITNELREIKSTVPADTTAQARLAVREKELQAEQRSLKNQIARAESAYQATLRRIGIAVNDGEAQMGQIGQQDQNILDTVATVRGTISLDWISYPQMIQAYLPAHWFSMLLGLLAVFFFVRWLRYSW